MNTDARKVDKAVESILRAPDYHLRATLVSLCSDNAHTRDKIAKHLDALSDHDKPASQENRVALKDLWLCIQCNAVFVHEHNEPDNCLHHPGESSNFLSTGGRR